MNSDTSVILKEPTTEQLTSSQMAIFKNKVENHFKLSLPSYQELHKWACENPQDFWAFLWNDCNIISDNNYKHVLSSNLMPGVKWFEGVQLNFAENCLHFNDNHTAIINCNEQGEINRTTYNELTKKVSIAQQWLIEQGIKKGDRVAAVVTNCEATIVLFLATASLGAIWTSCSPDFGVEAILSRFSNVKPRCLIFVSDYIYKNKTISIAQTITNILNQLTSVECAMEITTKQTSEFSNSTTYKNITNSYQPQQLTYTKMDFNDPLYILYSSGTTGKPKAIVHSIGGSLLEHIKEQRLHCDITRKDVLFYYTSCSWMMWNWLVSGLASGCSLVVFDGAPFYPKKPSTWQLISDYNITVYGTSAKFINASKRFNLKPKDSLNLSSLKTILSTGSPLYDEDFDYIYDHVKSDVNLCSISGGTDIVGCFALGNPLLPIKRGELQCISLGYPVYAYNDQGQSVIEEKGELICKNPAPSMPIYFWNDSNFTTYKSSYFNKYPNIWNHSDYIEITAQGGIKILGRSDATLNRSGIRIGTAEIYQLLEQQPHIEDSLVIHIEQKDHMFLFVKTTHNNSLTTTQTQDLKQLIKEKLSIRHCPNHIHQVTELPYTKNGKKVELAVKHIFTNQEEKINTSSLQNKDCLNQFRTIKQSYNYS